MPHAEHSVRVSVRERPAAAGPVPAFRPVPARFDLQGLQRFGSFLNCLSKKKSCSPAVKMNSPPQSAQVNSRSTNSITASPVCGTGRSLKGNTYREPLRAINPSWSALLGFQGPETAIEGGVLHSTACSGMRLGSHCLSEDSGSLSSEAFRWPPHSLGRERGGPPVVGACF